MAALPEATSHPHQPTGRDEAIILNQSLTETKSNLRPLGSRSSGNLKERLAPMNDMQLESLLGKIHQGDCLAGLAELPDGCVDLVFADPPFNIGYHYDQYDDKQVESDYLDWCAAWMGQLHRVLKADGTFWLAIGDEYAAELKIEAKKLGFQMRNWVVWYYTFGVHCKRKFTRSHAHLYYFVKDPARFTFQAEEVAVPSARQLVYADRRADPAGRVPDDTWILRPQDCDGFTAQEDTWYFPRVAGTFKERAGFHGCQMPEQLLGRIIRACSRPGELVIDPFSGSSTTLVVAKKLGRRHLGFELSAEYTALGMRRLESVAEGDPLEGAAEPRVSAPATRPDRAGGGHRQVVGSSRRRRGSSSQPLSKTPRYRCGVAEQDAVRPTWRFKPLVAQVC